MSKIGNYNLELEEELRDQLNELGFESLQDALSAGWEVLSLLDPVTGETSHHLQRVDDTELFVNDSVSLTNEAYEQAQKDWEREKREILDGLNESIDDVDNRFEGEPWAETVCEKINQAIEFLEKARF